MRQSNERRAPRPVRSAPAALSKMLSRSWSLPPQRNFVAVERNLRVPMSDGTVLLADHYLPIISRPALQHPHPLSARDQPGHGKGSRPCLTSQETSQ